MDIIIVPGDYSGRYGSVGDASGGGHGCIGGLYFRDDGDGAGDGWTVCYPMEGKGCGSGFPNGDGAGGDVYNFLEPISLSSLVKSKS